MPQVTPPVFRLKQAFVNEQDKGVSYSVSYFSSLKGGEARQKAGGD